MTSNQSIGKSRNSLGHGCHSGEPVPRLWPWLLLRQTWSHGLGRPVRAWEVVVLCGGGGGGFWVMGGQTQRHREEAVGACVQPASGASIIHARPCVGGCAGTRGWEPSSCPEHAPGRMTEQCERAAGVTCAQLFARSRRPEGRGRAGRHSAGLSAEGGFAHSGGGWALGSWRGGGCVFVGDSTYKGTGPGPLDPL